MASKLTLCHTSAAADPKLYPYLHAAQRTLRSAKFVSDAGVPKLRRILGARAKQAGLLQGLHFTDPWLFSWRLGESISCQVPGLQASSCAA